MPRLDFLTSEKKIRANIRYWTAKVLLSRAAAQDHEKGGFGIVNPERVNDEKNPKGSSNSESRTDELRKNPKGSGVAGDRSGDSEF